MSKHEPAYTCNKCNEVITTEEIEDHTDLHIQEGILKELLQK